MYQLVFVPGEDPSGEVILAEFETSFAAEAARDALIDAANDNGWVGYNGWTFVAQDELIIEPRFKPKDFNLDLIHKYADGWDL
jgi:hypothetical protein